MLLMILCFFKYYKYVPCSLTSLLFKVHDVLEAGFGPVII